MPKFKFLNFDYNLLKIDDIVSTKEATLIIYPTQNNANMAQAYSQHLWQFENISYISIEDLLDIVLPAESIILEDDKRVIALYQLLNDEEKLFFQITDFFDFIKLGNKIFTLFDELAFELIDFKEVIKLLEVANSSIFPWQVEYYQKLLNLLERYERWLIDKKMNDKIFLKNDKNIDLEYFQQYNNFYVINQFYYTSLERKLIKSLEEDGKNITLVYQLPEAYVDKESFNALPYEYCQLEKIASNKPILELTVDRNRFTMYNSLCKIISEKEIKQVIDRDFYESPYSQILSKKVFDINYSKSMQTSDVYTFLCIIQDIIEAIEYYNNNSYLALKIIIRSLLNKTFSRYFAIEDKDDLVEELYLLSDKGVIYCDLQGNIAKEELSEKLKNSLESIFALINKVCHIRSIDSLISLFDQENGIILDRISSPDELLYTNIKEVVYTELANLKTYTYNKLVNKWSDLSNKADHVIIFKLFCDGLKAKTLKYTELEEKKGVRINSLLDTRNNSYESLVFLNMIEGILPARRSSQFLFTERQREILTLKSYEEIRLREKYYFHRLVLSAKRCYFLAIESLDEDISISSFLEELPLQKPNKETRQADLGYAELFSYQLTERITPEECSPDFWRIKLSSQELTKGKSMLKLSYTKLKTLIDNPLYFLLRDWSKVNERNILSDPALDYRFIGIFAQNYINHIIARINDNFINQNVFYKFQYMNRTRLEEIYDSYLYSYSEKDYYIPHNYSYKFLTDILKNLLVEGMLIFFNFVMHSKLYLSEKELTLIPEEGFRKNKKMAYKNFINEDESIFHLAIAVTGDADLRIENKDKSLSIVIDFKTGKYSLDQLALYQYIYYWDEIKFGRDIRAGIFQIIKQEWKEQSKSAEDTVRKLQSKVIDTLNEIALNGFSIPKNKTKAEYYSKITRADLLNRG